MATTVTITYADEHEDAVELRAIDMVKAERHFKGALPSIEGTLYAAWQRLRPGASFNDWLDDVDRMDVKTEDDGDPLATGPSPAT
jgi:hypothetical protein